MHIHESVFTTIRSNSKYLKAGENADQENGVKSDKKSFFFLFEWKLFIKIVEYFHNIWLTNDKKINQIVYFDA